MVRINKNFLECPTCGFLLNDGKFRRVDSVQPAGSHPEIPMAQGHQVEGVGD